MPVKLQTKDWLFGVEKRLDGTNQCVQGLGNVKLIL